MRRRFVSLLLVLGLIVAVGVAAAIANAGHNETSKQLVVACQVDSTAISNRVSQARGLLSILGVLRRSQTRADRNPRLLAIVKRQSGGLFQRFGTPVISLIRLATVTPSGGKLFLVPIERPGHAATLEHFTLFGVEGGGGCCAPVSFIERYGVGSFGGSGKPHTAHTAVLIVPDGVSKVTIFPPMPGGRRSLGVTAAVYGNVASFAFRGALEDPFKYMIWYGPSGSIIRRIG